MIALTGGKILTMCGKTLDRGTILVRNGKIQAVGKNIDIPAECRVIDAAGKVITPGLIDAHTHLGVYSEGMGWAGEDINERSEPVTPAMDALDAINPAEIGLWEAYRGGVTTVMVAPGSANPIGGQCVIIKTPQKATVEQMLLKRHAGLKIAFGENPKRSHGVNHKKMPVTRMATAALIRETFWQARHYIARQDEKDFQYNVGLEAVAKVLRREMPLRAHAHRADDIVTAIRIAREFDLDIIIEHGTEAYLVADLLAEAKIPVIVGPTLSTRSKVELKDKTMELPALLFNQGVTFAMMSDHPVIPSCFLSVYAGLAVRYGLPKDQALRMITCDAAKILGLADRIGSLAPGMDADLVVWSEDPMLISASPEIVMVDGQTGE
ncbi:MAG TPA: amidohydrolase [Methylomusa anaerophila]|uniref:Dihydroorotase n=1 Tax=Methylomusa anaerophila TaxID=1930071 RepID=A0A348AJ65_9FIRM|nr:amidohydrolase [Methylomusa anaerophila]BBB91113.1 dihydroorotase [Methylomusa anaerophila]HML88990.1 amidohydrolase [Methylomusa anaerophila]